MAMAADAYLLQAQFRRFSNMKIFDGFVFVNLRLSLVKPKIRHDLLLNLRQSYLKSIKIKR